jgi:hypothetical protein
VIEDSQHIEDQLSDLLEDGDFAAATNAGLP